MYNGVRSLQRVRTCIHVHVRRGTVARGRALYLRERGEDREQKIIIRKGRGIDSRE